MTGPMRDDVLVVIPCLNEAAILPGLLARQLTDAPDVEVVVVDGGSTDGSRELVEGLGDARVQLLDNPWRLQSAGINLAVREAAASVRWIVRMDAHCDYPAGYVAGLIAAAEKQGATSVVVPMESRGTRCFQVAAAAAQNSRIGTGGSPHRHVGEGGWVDHGHHALMDRALFEKVGGYHEDMPTNEDAELDLRLGKAGGRIWLEPGMALVYYPRASIGALWRQYWKYGLGRAKTLRLHGQRPKLRQALPLAVPVAVGLAVLTPLHWVFAVPVLAWAAAVLGGGLLVGAKAGGGCALGCGVAAMTMHLAWGLGFLRQFSARG